MGTGGAGSEPGPVTGQARGDHGYRARPYARRRHDAIAFCRYQALRLARSPKHMVNLLSISFSFTYYL